MSNPTEAELLEEVARLKAELRAAKVEKFNLLLELLMTFKIDEDFSYLEYILLSDPELHKRFKKAMEGSSRSLKDVGSYDS